MATLSNIPVSALRDAATAWRENDAKAKRHWLASGPLRFLMSEPNLSLYDRVDDLIDEIERLRAQR